MSNDYPRPPEEYPALREAYPAPLEEDFGWHRREASPPEYPKPAPEWVEPGTYPDTEPERRGRRLALRRLMMYLAASAMVLLLLPELKTGNQALPAPAVEAEPTPVAEPVSIAAPAEDTPSPDTQEAIPVVPEENLGDPGDVEIVPVYAVLDGSTVKYSYYLWYNDADEPAAKVYTQVIGTGSSEQAVPDNDPDEWYLSRSAFEYTVDASRLSGDLTLILRAVFVRGGVEKEVLVTRPVEVLPPAPTLSAAVTGTDEIDYTASFIPAPGDRHDYRLHPQNFYYCVYDTDMNYGGLAYVEDENTVPEMSVDPAGGYRFHYQGPAHLDNFAVDAAYYTLQLEIVDETTGYPYMVETEPVPVSQQEESGDWDDAFPALPNLDPDFAGAYAWSGEGPEQYVRFRSPSGGEDTYLEMGSVWAQFGGRLSSGVAGASYDAGSNTLTLENFSGSVLDVNLMGNGFTIELVGSNRLDQLVVWGAGYGGSVTLTGSGSLTVGNGILLNAEGSQSCVMIDGGVTLDLYGETPIAVQQTTAEKAVYYLKPLRMTGAAPVTQEETAGSGTGQLYDYTVSSDEGHIHFSPS